ncbi:hypothetical protein BP5796_05908 [Coleophoma crateriformis]|uniref:WSC domain-containing protein n=1 Tax=Coleophoma crateriformis TaxID=565419 RepID=A0A3D8RVQ0_9HELO|nr:hypothetical protein BP5796_05908 [Coleophoma crateriformis]
MALFPLLQPFALLLLLLCQSTSAQSTTTTSAASTTTSTAATIYPGNSKYTYLGCYNETTTLNNTAMTRALQGTSESNDTMTVEVCLAFCAGSTYAGLEYTKECYCSPYISALSVKLDDAQCNLPCVANGSEICGGALKVSVYQLKSSTSTGKSAAPGSMGGSGRAAAGSALALGAVVGGLLWL